MSDSLEPARERHRRRNEEERLGRILGSLDRVELIELATAPELPSPEELWAAVAHVDAVPHSEISRDQPDLVISSWLEQQSAACGLGPELHLCLYSTSSWARVRVAPGGWPELWSALEVRELLVVDRSSTPRGLAVTEEEYAYQAFLLGSEQLGSPGESAA